MTTIPTSSDLRDRLHALSEALPASVRDVCAILKTAGFQAFLAGGCVRDLMLGREVQDFDLATSALPGQVQPLFRRVIPTGLQHGTVTVLHGDQKIEVTTFRGEGEYLDGRRPERVVFLDDVEADLARRDFTMNAMAWDPIARELRDPFGGADDLARGLVRAVGDPFNRFVEDGLRPLRAVRFTSVLAFELDPATKAAIPQTLATFRKVARERVRDELEKLLVRSPRPSVGLELLADTGLLAEFAPELLEGKGVAQNRWHAHDVWQHVLHVVDASAPRLVVRLSALLHDVAKPRTARPKDDAPGENSFHGHEFAGAELATQILERLKFPRKVIDAVAHQVREHNWYYLPDWNDGTVRRTLARLGDDEALEDFFALREADLVGRGRGVEAALEHLALLRARLESERAKANALSIKDLALSGADVMQALGRGPGPYVGETLRALLQHVLDHPEDNTRERLLARLGAIATA